MQERRSRKCPKCGSEFLCRQNDKIICLNYGCNWNIEAKRNEDKEIKTLSFMKREFR